MEAWKVESRMENLVGRGMLRKEERTTEGIEGVKEGKD